jgi:hypothetical protein
MWKMGTTYAHTAAGLAQCYVAAIPFFGNTIASDLLFTGVFFSVYGGLVAHRLASPQRH